MQPASRGSLTAARQQLDEFADGAGTDELTQLGDELAAVAALLLAERGLRRSMVDPSASDEARRGLVERLFGSKVGERTLQTLTALVASRWSRSLDLADALEELGRQALLAVAEHSDTGEDTLSEVEDELFRFGRIVAAQPQLADLLSDRTSPASQRVELLERVLGGKVAAVTMRLLEQVVRSPRERNLDQVAEQLVERAAARRERYVAHVSSPLPLSEEQERRLADVLGRIYRRRMSLQTELDPDLLGGLVIRVGDEVIDGSVADRLERARHGLPR
ncbi:MAG: F0F1 ATP synthase subunit delta [Pseudonocardiaceae bacterium]|nr:F0F1 ATP synthase subunit delta [Pseudonocardiaceae bacterium]